MPSQLYRCDRCNREVDKTTTDKTTSRIGRCTITQFCKGSLYPITHNSLSTYTTPDILELQDYQQRNILYVHDQQLTEYTWAVTHNQGTDPIVRVYQSATTPTGAHGGYTLIEPSEYVVTYDDLVGNKLSIEFADKKSGIAHIISREGAVDKVSDIVSNTVWDIIAPNGILTIGTPVGIDVPQVVTLDLTFIKTSTNVHVTIPVPFTAHKHQDSIALFNTPWKTYNTIQWANMAYKVRSIRISTVLESNGVDKGSPVYFRGDCIILGSTMPHSDPCDIVTGYVYHPNRLNTSPPANLKWDSGLVIDSALATPHHPPLTILSTIY